MSRIKMESVPVESADGQDVGSEAQRTCSKCGHAWPATKQFYYADATGAGGLSSTCKGCKRAFARARWARKRGQGTPEQSCSMQPGCEVKIEIGDDHWEILSLDLEAYPEIMPALRTRALKEIRTPVEQAVWELRNALCGGAA